MNKNLSTFAKIIPFIIVAVALVIGYFMLQSGKIERPKRSAIAKQIRTVKVLPLEQTSIVPTWQATGIVIASESVKVVAEVTGVVEKINPKARPGSLLNKGEWLVQLNQADYQLSLQSQQAQLIRAEATLELEAADQRLAKEELALVGDIQGGNVDVALVLREPQIKSAKAQVAIAEVNIEKAKVDLTRTLIKMPFKGQIIQNTVGTGSRVSTNSTLFDVVNVDTFWLEVKVPRAFLPLLSTEKPAILSQESLWGEGQTRSAKIISILPELDSRDRQVKLLLEITDPLALEPENKNQPIIFINDFVSVELQGREIDDAWQLNVNLLQNDNTIWVADKNSTLQKRTVQVIFKSRDTMYIHAKFEDGDMVLHEKPGIAAIGLPVITKNVNQAIEKKDIDFSQLEKATKKIKNKQANKEHNKVGE